jgi:hypothetical protein
MVHSGLGFAPIHPPPTKEEHSIPRCLLHDLTRPRMGCWVASKSFAMFDLRCDAGDCGWNGRPRWILSMNIRAEAPRVRRGPRVGALAHRREVAGKRRIRCKPLSMY